MLGDAIQTVMRRHKVEEPYEKLKALTRGQRIDQGSLLEFLNSLEIPEDEKERLRELTPSGYTGDAAALAKRV